MAEKLWIAKDADGSDWAFIYKVKPKWNEAAQTWSCPFNSSFVLRLPKSLCPSLPPGKCAEVTGIQIGEILGE